MKWFQIICLALSLTVTVTRAANIPTLNDPKAGEELARKVRSLAPAENAEFRGMFEIEQPNGNEQFIPIKSQIIVTNEGWRQIYLAETPAGKETLTILHRPGKAPTFTHALPRRESVSLIGDRATNAFAGTDFALIDLGLGFFHWPTQALLTREMKKGRGCDVLESRPANIGLYSRVITWIDQETSGVLMAEAYDARGRLLKEFEIRKFDRDAGQVREMEIRNRQTKGSTRLRFETGAK